MFKAADFRSFSGKRDSIFSWLMMTCTSLIRDKGGYKYFSPFVGLTANNSIKVPVRQRPAPRGCCCGWACNRARWSSVTAALARVVHLLKKRCAQRSGFVVVTLPQEGVAARQSHRGPACPVTCPPTTATTFAADYTAHLATEPCANVAARRHVHRARRCAFGSAPRSLQDESCCVNESNSEDEGRD